MYLPFVLIPKQADGKRAVPLAKGSFDELEGQPPVPIAELLFFASAGSLWNFAPAERLVKSNESKDSNLLRPYCQLGNYDHHSTTGRTALLSFFRG